MINILNRTMIQASRLLIFLVASSCLTMVVIGQQTENPAGPDRLPNPKNRNTTDDPTNNIGEMVVKQQISRRKKDHEDLLKRGDEALKLSEELEAAITKNESIDARDLAKLESLEKIVSKIRKEIGGDNDDIVLEGSSEKENSARQSIATAFRFLLDSTRSLVDELKRTSRFSISALAIETSNSVIRFARFLRLKK